MKVLIFEGTPGEVADLLERMPQLNSTIHHSSGAASGADAVPQNPKMAVWTKERVIEMWNCLYGDQQKLVEFIVRKAGKVTMADAQKYLGFSKGPAIAGVMSSITRNARRITKYKEARFVEDWIDQKKGVWGYYLPRYILAVLVEILAKKN